MAWLTNPWVVDGIAAGVLLLGLLLAVWGLWGDRSRGRARCPRCWYDMQGRAAGEKAKCPECGHEAKNERRLFRDRRRWWAVVVALVVFVVPSSFVLYVVVDWQREQAVVEAVRPHIFAAISRWVGPAWLEKRLPTSLRRYGERVVEIDAGGSRFNDSDMVHLSKLMRLEELYIWHTEVTDVGPANLQELKNLHALAIQSLKITNEGLVHLQALEGLRSLDLMWTEVTDAGLVHLKELKALQWLNLASTNVTDIGLDHLKELNSLHQLRLDGSLVTEEGVANLRKAMPQCVIQH